MNELFDAKTVRERRTVFFCEVTFSIDKMNWCFRDFTFYRAEFNGRSFDLIEDTSDQFNSSKEVKWTNFKERPISVIKLWNKKAILFKDHYILSPNDNLQKLSYSNLFPSYDTKNLILNAYYDVLTKRYWFIGSKFNFLYYQSDLNDQNRFIVEISKLTQPLYGNCLRSPSSDHFSLALLFGILFSFILILVIIGLTYLKQFRSNEKHNFARKARNYGRKI